MDLEKLGLKLGEKTTEDGLDPVPRALSRQHLPSMQRAMHGHDLWNAWEVSYLTQQGLPKVWHMQCVYAADTPNIVESKSFKLFLNARNNECFDSLEAFEDKVRTQLEACVGGSVGLHFYAPETSPSLRVLAGDCVDTADVISLPEGYAPETLKTAAQGSGNFAFHSHLLRSLCPVTAQPDWGGVEIIGEGAKAPAPASLLAYIVSLRNHQDFHEACCERIYVDLCEALQPDRLSVRCLYTRRGGLDICPVRSTDPEPETLRAPTWRQ